MKILDMKVEDIKLLEQLPRKAVFANYYVSSRLKLKNDLDSKIEIVKRYNELRDSDFYKNFESKLLGKMEVRMPVSDAAKLLGETYNSVTYIAKKENLIEKVGRINTIKVTDLFDRGYFNKRKFVDLLLLNELEYVDNLYKDTIREVKSKCRELKNLIGLSEAQYIEAIIENVSTISNDKILSIREIIKDLYLKYSRLEKLINEYDIVSDFSATYKEFYKYCKLAYANYNNELVLPFPNYYGLIECEEEKELMKIFQIKTNIILRDTPIKEIDNAWCEEEILKIEEELDWSEEELDWSNREIEGESDIDWTKPSLLDDEDKF